MSVLEAQQRIGDDNTESVEPNSKVLVLFFGDTIHGTAVSLTNPGPTTRLSIALPGGASATIPTFRRPMFPCRLFLIRVFKSPPGAVIAPQLWCPRALARFP